MTENKHVELERRLLDVYSEAKEFADMVKSNRGFDEVSILDAPWGSLAGYGDQSPEEGPFWTLLRSENDDPYWFYVISIGLKIDRPSIALRYRDGMEGGGRSYNGNEIKKYFLDNQFATLSQLYKGWFSGKPKSQKKLSEEVFYGIL